MVVMYEIAGKKVGSHVVRPPALHLFEAVANSTFQLAMATLSLAAAGGYLGTRGGEKKKDQGPPINATNQDEEKFIK